MPKGNGSMPETLTARRPLGSSEDAPLRTFGDAGAIELRERPLEEALALQFDAGDRATIALIREASGLDLAGDDRTAAAGGLVALWLGPGDWLVRPGEVRGALEGLQRAARQGGCSLVDASDQWCAVEVAGRFARDLLAKGCSIDLRDHAFPAGASAVLRFARVRALIHCVDASPSFHVYVERSYAAYLWAWLVDAVSEWTSTVGGAR